MESKYFIAKYLVLFFLISLISIIAQSPGLIYKPAGNSLGKLVLDPNGDGAVSAVGSTWVLNGIDYGSASELNMIPLPELSLEPVNDLLTGAGGGITDLVRNENDNSKSQSVYVLTRKVAGIDYLIVRFRIGKAASNKKGYSLLIDTDGDISGDGKNPGFEKEIVLRQTVDVAIYTHAGETSTLDYSYDLNNHTQFSFAASNNSSTIDYLYDFFVPLEDIGTEDIVRIAAATITNASSGILGTISDVDGIDDSKFGTINKTLKALINVFPATTKLSELTNADIGFGSPITSAPTITSNLNESSISISGTSYEIDETSIEIFKNNVLIGSTTVSNNSWTLSGISGLILGDLITAKATAIGKTISSVSNEAAVAADAICYLPVPLITSLDNGKRDANGTWFDENNNPPLSNTVSIQLYQQSGIGTFASVSSPVYVSSVDGTWKVSTGLAQSAFASATFYAVATYGSCLSGYSNGVKGNTGTLVLAPTINTTTILQNTSSTTINITNNYTSAATIILYVNGTEVTRTSSTVASGANTDLSYAGFLIDDKVTARAFGTTALDFLSNPSNLVTVSAAKTSSPIVLGQLTSANTIVSGSSEESPGSIIKVYSGTNLIGSTTVDAYGNWEVNGLTLSSSPINNANQITAVAQALNKTESNPSTIVTVTTPVTSPIVTGPIQSGDVSVSGSNAQNSLIIYVDGMAIDTLAASGSWNLSGINPSPFYRGAEVTASNLVNGVHSDQSAPIIVSGPVSFKITTITDDNNLGNVIAGNSFQVKFTAVDGSNGDGNLYSSFVSTVDLSSSSNISQGAGTSASFTSGVLGSHDVTLTTAGSNKVIQIVNSSDPCSFGSNTINVLPSSASLTASTITLSKSQIINDESDFATVTLRLYDIYGNALTASAGTVLFSANNNAIISEVTDNNNGTYTATITSATVGISIITATLNGSDLENLEELLVLDKTAVIYYSRITGNWSEASTWSTVSHLGIAASQAPTSEDVVFIGSNDNVTLDANVTNNNSVHVKETGELTTGNYILEGSGSFNLYARGKIYVGSPQGITSSGSTGNIQTLSRSFSSEASYIYNGASFQVSGDALPSIISYLKIDNTNNVTLTNSVNVSDTLELANGIIHVGTDNLITLGSSINSTGMLVFNDSPSPEFTTWINGNLKRYVSDLSSENIFFPVGCSNHWGGAVVKYSNSKTVGGTLTGKFIMGDPTTHNSGSLLDNSYTINSYSEYGCWTISNTTVTGTYSIELDAYNFSGISNELNSAGEVKRMNLRVIKRENSSAEWAALGTHKNGRAKRTSNPGLGWVVTRSGLTSFSDFTLGSNAADNDLGNSLLPVELTSLQASIIDNKVLLSWQTAIEVNNYGFEIERNLNPPHNPLQGGEGTEQQDWEKIGFIEGHGNSNSPKSYSFIDETTQNGKYSFRLKQIDFDGKFEYSDEIEVEVNMLPTEFELKQNYPNPFNPKTSIEYSLPSNVNVSLKIYDVLGNEVRTLVNENQKPGYYKILLNAGSLSSGVYFYRIETSAGFVSTKKLMLLK